MVPVQQGKTLIAQSVDRVGIKISTARARLGGGVPYKRRTRVKMSGIQLLRDFNLQGRLASISKRDALISFGDAFGKLCCMTSLCRRLY